MLIRQNQCIYQMQVLSRHLSKSPETPTKDGAGSNSNISSSTFNSRVSNASSNTTRSNASSEDNSEGLEPVRLAYASYEATVSPKHVPPPPLVIMHGLFGSKGNWNSLCKALHQKTIPQRKIIALDARNHGDSPHSKQHSYEHLAEDIKGFLKEKRILKATMLGHSMGGRAMMYFALKYPSLVDKLIVADISPVSTSPSLTSMPGLFKALLSVQLPSGIPASKAKNEVDIQLARIVNERGLRQFLLTNLVQKPDKSYAWRVNIPILVKHFSKNIAVFPDVAGKVYEGPVQFLGGGASDYIQRKDHPQILKIFPNAQFKYIEGAGHWLHSEKPQEFLKHTLEFLNKDVIIE